MKLEVEYYDTQIQLSTPRPERLNLVEGHLAVLRDWENDSAVRNLNGVG